MFKDPICKLLVANIKHNHVNVECDSSLSTFREENKEKHKDDYDLEHTFEIIN